jgi:hypothetical protein
VDFGSVIVQIALTFSITQPFGYHYEITPQVHVGLGAGQQFWPGGYGADSAGC